ncbi:MAG: Gfo/Idh/MocA family oxidoreductase [Planctomycetota bacterium]
MKPLRAGLSGCGAIGLAAIEQVRRHEHCDIVAVHDPDPNVLETLRARTGIGFATTDFAALLASGIDFVVLAGPPGTRLPQVQQAAEQNVHCLVHAPFANDLTTAAAMVDACEAADVKLGVAVPGQADPVLEQVRRMIASDWLGGIVAVQTMLGSDDLLVNPPVASDPRLHADAARDPFAAFASQCVHMATWLTGRPALRVTAQTVNGFLPLPHDGGAVTAVLGGNVLCTFLASHLTRVRTMAVHGTDGGVRLAGDRIWLCGKTEFHGDLFDYTKPGHEQGFARAELEEATAAQMPDCELHGRFARWIDDCDGFPCPGEQALADQRVVDAMLRAAASGRVETV